MSLNKDTILKNRYRIDKLFAHEGIGAIYRGFDTKLNVSVVIKENVFQSAQAIAQFEQEALVLTSLRHPNLPRVTDHFNVEERQYLVANYVEGQDLWGMVKKQGHPLSERQGLIYIIKICDAVAYLHGQNPPIIHQDIKPWNIIANSEDQPFLVDFGMAKIGDGRDDTRVRGVTPCFSPPEQYSRVGTTLPSDIYALGATLYALLTAQEPPDSVTLVAGTSLTPPHQINPKISKPLSEAIVHAMQVQLADRPQSVEWKNRLQTILESLAITTEEEYQETVLTPLKTVKYWLVDEAGVAYRIGSKGLMIGRYSGADVVLKEPQASNHHAIIRLDGQNCWIMDNGSLNDTFLNKEKLPAGWQPLQDRDALRIASTHFKVTTTEPPPVAPPTIERAAKATAVAAPKPPMSETAVDSEVAPVPAPAPVIKPNSAGSSNWLIVAAVLAFLAIWGGYLLFGSSSVDENAYQTQTAEAKVVVQKTAEAKAIVQKTIEAHKRVLAISSTVRAETAIALRDATATPASSPIPATATPLPPTEAMIPTATLTVTPTNESAIASSSPTTSITPTVSTSTPIGPTLVPLKSAESIPQIGNAELLNVDINPKNPNEVYALVKGKGIYKSSHGGDGTWDKMNLSGVTSFTIDPTNPTHFYATAWSAVLQSTDGGNNWEVLGNDDLINANQPVYVITVDAASPNILYGGIGRAFIVSTNGGKNWTSAGYGQGLSQGQLTSIVVDPFNHDVIFVGGKFGSIYKSVDSGRNFTQLSFSVGEGTYSIVAHPTQKDVYLAGINSPNAAIIKTKNGADFQSVSRGLSFSGAFSAYSTIVYAPSNSNIVYAGSGYEDDRLARGIFKSTDEGESWKAINNGLSISPITDQPRYVKSITVHPTNPDLVFAATGGGLYKSTDGGENWVLQ